MVSISALSASGGARHADLPIMRTPKQESLGCEAGTGGGGGYYAAFAACLTEAPQCYRDGDRGNAGVAHADYKAPSIAPGAVLALAELPQLSPLSSPRAGGIAFVIRWGPDAPADWIRQRVRCSVCGHRGADTTMPSWHDML
jgi:hypothetical protein